MAFDPDTGLGYDPGLGTEGGSAIGIADALDRFGGELPSLPAGMPGLPGLFDIEGRLQDPRTAGPTIVGLLGGSAFGGLATISQMINDRYFGGMARADVDQNVGGPGGSFEEMLRAVGSPDLERLLAGFRGLPGASEAEGAATPANTALPLLTAPAALFLPPLAPQMSGASFGGMPSFGAGFNLF